MKKLMTAFAACALAGAVFAQIESQNVVGYSTMSLYKGWNMVALNWDLVGDAAAGISVQDIIADPLGSGLAGGAVSTEADQIWIRNNATGGSTALYLYDKNTAQYPDEAAHNKWIEDGSVSTTVLQAGDAFWLNRLDIGAATVVVPVYGQVPNDISLTREVFTGWNMLGSGFAADFNPNGGFDWLAAGAFGGAVSTEADQIQIRDNSNGSSTALYLYDKNTAQYPDEAAHNKWIEDGSVSTSVVPLTGGMWYYHRGTGFDWVETKPYTLN